MESKQHLSALEDERAQLTSQLVLVASEQDGSRNGSQRQHNRLHELLLRRAAVHHGLGYPDLAASDAYRALGLLESYLDPADKSESGCEMASDGEGEGEKNDDAEEERREPVLLGAAKGDAARCLRALVVALSELDCWADAAVYLERLAEWDRELIFFTEDEHVEMRERVAGAKAQNEAISSGRLQQQGHFGFARREVYRWNDHEPDRAAVETLRDLNDLLTPVAPDLEVRSVELPVLGGGSGSMSSTADPSQFEEKARSLQLGLFAKVDLHSSLPILNEPSVLAAVRLLDAPLCHNCGTGLPSSSSSSSDPEEPCSCPSCAEAAVFCSRACLDIAQTKYHAVMCGNEDVDLLGRTENADHPSEDLYFLLVARALAMSCAQNTHPLDLPETKYLWGEFEPEAQPERKPARTLPFSFQHNIVLPFRLLSLLFEEHPELSPFSARGLDWYDGWVVQTLYAKFRGVASARQSTWDGKPEVAAVHPLWCLANHSCAPNVEWDWGRKRVFQVREKPVTWGCPPNHEVKEDISVSDWNGIKAGEEILSHYCDLDLSVGQRREYMLGSLGGECMCERCRWEAGHGGGK